MILQVILEFIFYFIFEGIVLRLFKAIKWLGLVVLKCLTLSSASIKTLEEQYQDSSKPWFLGFGLMMISIYLIWQ